MSGEPWVDIIITTYNRAHLLPKSVGSALGQTYPRIRVLVVDDASTDNTTAVLATMSHERLTVFRNSYNRGVTGAKNVGLDRLPSDSTYFGILDSDDSLTPKAIECLVDGFTLGNFSQVMGRCRDGSTSNIVSLMDGNPCVHREVVTFNDVMRGRISGEYWHLAQSSLVRQFRFESRARGGESLVWHGMLRADPALAIPVDVRIYDTSGCDRVSLGHYSHRAARGRMWAYRAYVTEFGRDLPNERAARLLGEAAKYALFAGEWSYGISALRRLASPPRTKARIVVWPIYAALRGMQTGICSRLKKPVTALRDRAGSRRRPRAK